MEVYINMESAIWYQNLTKIIKSHNFIVLYNLENKRKKSDRIIENCSNFALSESKKAKKSDKINEFRSNFALSESEKSDQIIENESDSFGKSQSESENFASLSLLAKFASELTSLSTAIQEFRKRWRVTLKI